MRGWFVDRTAQGWAGADTVEIFLGVMGNGGTPLAHAFFAQDRPDVAAALGDPYWAASGWSALIPASQIPPGAQVLSVYAHSPATGWWYRQVRINMAAPATGTPAPTPVGYDISFPQCGSPEPNAPAFAIVGVNGGRAFTPNPCLARQYAWALSATSPSQPKVSFYMNTGNPGPTVSQHWPGSDTTAPQPCDGSWSEACAFDYGWLAAEDAVARARLVAGGTTSLVPWWLDVESANSWSENVATNAASLQGGIAFLRSQQVPMIGIYTLASDWEEIVGATAANDQRNAPFTGLPNWRPGASSAAETGGWCVRTVTGGRVEFVQYPSGGFDANQLCPP
jgi:hypothetical protein